MRSTIVSAMFALHQTDSFLFRFFPKKRMGFGATPHINGVFFLLAFSFALAVSKEKAVCGLDFVKNYSRFFMFAHPAVSA